MDDPGRTDKMVRVHVVPLASPAVALFERAKKFKAGASDLVFRPGREEAALGHEHTSRSYVTCHLAVTVHGIRSAFRDWVAEQTD